MFGFLIGLEAGVVARPLIAFGRLKLVVTIRKGAVLLVARPLIAFGRLKLIFHLEVEELSIASQDH